MNIDQPQPNIVLPEDLRAQIDSARLNVAELDTRVTILINQSNGLKKDNATLTKEHDYLIEQISKALGHLNSDTTRSYLAHFNKESKVNLSNIISNF